MERHDVRGEGLVIINVVQKVDFLFLVNSALSLRITDCVHTTDFATNSTFGQNVVLPLRISFVGRFMTVRVIKRSDVFISVVFLFISMELRLFLFFFFSRMLFEFGVLSMEMLFFVIVQCVEIISIFIRIVALLVLFIEKVRHFMAVVIHLFLSFLSHRILE